MKRRSIKTLLFTYAVVMAIATAGFIVRWVSGKFSLEFNSALFFTSIIIISLVWEGLRWVHAWLNAILPFEKCIPGRIALQLFIGFVISITFCFASSNSGEPYLHILCGRV